MPAASSDISIQPKVEFPADGDLPDLQGLFDGRWVWQAYQNKFGEQELDPHRVQVQGISHTQGREALVSYELQWHPEAYLPDERFTLHMERGKPLRISRFPDDSYLPGLGEACRPEPALDLVSRYVMAIPPRRMRVQVIRYRPGSHAVLRCRMGKVRLYVRVVRPSAVTPILKSGELIGQSAFAVPRLAGLWREGGVLWLSEIPGRNMRRQLQTGEQPDPGLILDRLESLWAVPLQGCDSPPFNLPGGYRRAKEILSHALGESDEGSSEYRGIIQMLDPFIDSWRATAVAHNDFYDDQMVVLPDGKIALVDFEGAGPGDPMLDVGNFLAHLKWTSQFGRRSGGSGEYYGSFREESLVRLQCTENDLNLREAVCLFRICTNAVRHPRDDWRENLAAGLSLVEELLV